jgi:organic radical activating enzyme
MIKLSQLNGQPEIFYTIQGEGKNLGQPSVFVRLSLCNLYCVWCDTDYTWNWKGTRFSHVKDQDPGYIKYSKEEMIVQLPDEEIARIVTAYGCPNLVFTGGEPLVQQKELASLFSMLKEMNPDFRIEIETNGTLIPSLCDRFTDQYNVSLKLGNSRVVESERLKPAAIAFFASSPKANFKFVIDTQADLQEVLKLIADYDIPKHRVYLMPQGLTATVLKEKQQWLVEICKQYGFRYTDRLHIHIYGDKRGV